MAKNNNNRNNNNNNNTNNNNTNNNCNNNCNNNNNNNSNNRNNNSINNNNDNKSIETQLAKVKEFTLSKEENEKYFLIELHVNTEYLMIVAVDKKTNYLYKSLFTLNDLYKLDRYFKLFDTPEDVALDINERFENKSVDIECDKLSFIFIIIKWQLNSKDFETKVKLIGKETNKELQMIQMSNAIDNLTKSVSELQLELKQKDRRFNYLTNFINIKSEIFQYFYQYENILKQIEKSTNKIPVGLTILHKSEKNGTSYETIKNNVFKKSNIIVLMKNSENYDFGGYTSTFFDEYNNSNNDLLKTDSTAFIFNAWNSKIFPVKDASHAIRLNRNNLFMFGDTDIVIKRNFGDSYYSYGYNSNVCSTAQSSYDFVEKDYPFTGKQNYTIKKLEVYQCVFES